LGDRSKIQKTEGGFRGTTCGPIKTPRRNLTKISKNTTQSSENGTAGGYGENNIL
jgi:hypothetical protein